MKSYIFVLVLLVPLGAEVNPLYAQGISADQFIYYMDYSAENGWIPESIETMVSTSHIIVKGRFGNLISNQPFWGYGESRESFIEKLNISDEEADRMAIPLSEYEIVIDEVVFGDIKSDKIVYRVFESYPSEEEELDQKKSIERLFFLRLNEDGETYSSIGQPFILDNIDGEYSFLARGRSITDTSRKTLPFVESMQKVAFEQAIKQEVARQMAEIGRAN